MAPRTKDDALLWKWTTSVLTAVLLTGLASWFSFGKAATAQDIRAAIDEHEKHPHIGAVTRAEWEHLMHTIEVIEVDVRELRSRE